MELKTPADPQPIEPRPYESFVRRLLFHLCDCALRTGQSGPICIGRPLHGKRNAAHRSLREEVGIFEPRLAPPSFWLLQRRRSVSKQGGQGRRKLLDGVRLRKESRAANEQLLHPVR
jgi:hypothetical protein